MFGRHRDGGADGGAPDAGQAQDPAIPPHATIGDTTGPDPVGRPDPATGADAVDLYAADVRAIDGTVGGATVVDLRSAQVARAVDPEAKPDRRGLRPLSVLALCCLVAVSAVLVTQAAHPFGATGSGSVAIATENGGVQDAASDNGGTDADSTDADSTDSDATADPSTGPATATPAAPAARPAPQPAPPAAGSSSGRPPVQSQSPAPSPAPPVTLSYEAEASSNALTGTRTFTCGPCSGGHKVGEVGDGKGTLQFNGVTAATTGMLPVTIYFLNGDGPRTAQLSVNGAAAVVISFPGTRDWNTVGSLTLYVSLDKGANQLKFFNSSAMAPDFDRLTVRS